MLCKLSILLLSLITLFAILVLYAYDTALSAAWLQSEDIIYTDISFEYGKSTSFMNDENYYVEDIFINRYYVEYGLSSDITLGGKLSIYNYKDSPYDQHSTDKIFYEPEIFLRNKLYSTGNHIFSLESGVTLPLRSYNIDNYIITSGNAYFLYLHYGYGFKILPMQTQNNWYNQQNYHYLNFKIGTLSQDIKNQNQKKKIHPMLFGIEFGYNIDNKRKLILSADHRSSKDTTDYTHAQLYYMRSYDDLILTRLGISRTFSEHHSSNDYHVFFSIGMKASLSCLISRCHLE